MEAISPSNPHKKKNGFDENCKEENMSSRSKQKN